MCYSSKSTIKSLCSRKSLPIKQVKREHSKQWVPHSEFFKGCVRFCLERRHISKIWRLFDNYSIWFQVRWDWLKIHLGSENIVFQQYFPEFSWDVWYRTLNFSNWILPPIPNFGIFDVILTKLCSAFLVNTIWSK